MSEEEQAVVVPTTEEKVRIALRYLGEPWILFGEDVCSSLGFFFEVLLNILIIY